MESINKEQILLEVLRNLPLDDLLELIKKNYSEGDITDFEYLNWQYNKNPSGHPFATISTYGDEKEIAGQYVVIPQNFSSSIAGDVKGTLSLNTLTDKKFRGKGLFTKMAIETYSSCSKENVPITIGFPNNNSLGGFVRKLEFENIGNVPLWAKPIKFTQIVGEIFARLWKEKNSSKHGAEKKLEFKDLDDGEYSLKKISWEDDENKINRFYELSRKNYKIYTKRDFNYLKWRYSTPQRSYLLLKLIKAKKIVGIIVLRSKILYGFSTGIIIDQTFSDNVDIDKKVAYKLISNVLKRNKISFGMTICQKNSNEGRQLNKSGFYHIPDKFLNQPFEFIIRKNLEFSGWDEYRKFDNWFLTFGDYDVL